MPSKINKGGKHAEDSEGCSLFMLKLFGTKKATASYGEVEPRLEILLCISSAHWLDG